MSSTIVIHNPESGSGDHLESVRKRATLLDWDHRVTEAAGDAVRLAETAAEDDYETVIAAGGDGTVNGVVRGLSRAEALDAVTLGVFPLGTGNNFAGQIGIDDVDTAVEAVQSGERRRVDVGFADERPFLNSCVAGLTAESSSETSVELKERFGVLAYVLTTLRSLSDYDSPRLDVTVDEDVETGDWTGDALCVLVGNGRRFALGSRTQADMEDGQFDVTVVEDVAGLDSMSGAIVDTLLGARSSHVVRFRTPSLAITTLDSEPTRFSLDGEMIEADRLALETRPRTLTLAVGAAYDPHPQPDQ